MEGGGVEGDEVDAEGFHQSVGSDGTGGSQGFLVVVVVDVEDCGHQVLDVLPSVVAGFHEPSSGVDGGLAVVEEELVEPSSTSVTGAGGGVGMSGCVSEAKTRFTVLMRG